MQRVTPLSRFQVGLASGCTLPSSRELIFVHFCAVGVRAPHERMCSSVHVCVRAGMNEVISFYHQIRGNAGLHPINKIREKVTV